jgi:uncharacterized protein
MSYIKDRFRSLFQFNDSPHRLAMAFALGVFIAFSPTVGLHTLTCLLLAWIFRLNKLAVITGAFVNNPWTIVPMFGFCLWFGTKIVGLDMAVPPIAWQEMSLGNAYFILKPYMLPFIAGTLVVGLIAAIVSYAFIYWAAVRRRESQAMPSSSIEHS